ncbi:hypothetical protein I7I50_12358 [Histoplasma capsulatum G186AR]|uniref:Uncharacterized protein n=1 Tax=Ajellomyces capsulatus TaxID=5037 RepID=A0A8H7YAP7_AJECA|nr:hypothetical protein I7I52_11330 [Histoplasma capsulatum]QSS70655.1 hypothetical protein I7I50_12358 [Histoplasma capsulatum G186AR]
MLRSLAEVGCCLEMELSTQLMRGQTIPSSISCLNLGGRLIDSILDNRHLGPSPLVSPNCRGWPRKSLHLSSSEVLEDIFRLSMSCRAWLLISPALDYTRTPKHPSPSDISDFDGRLLYHARFYSHEARSLLPPP